MGKVSLSAALCTWYFIMNLESYSWKYDSSQMSLHCLMSTVGGVQTEQVWEQFESWVSCVCVTAYDDDTAVSAAVDEMMTAEMRWGREMWCCYKCISHLPVTEICPHNVISVMRFDHCAHPGCVAGSEHHRYIQRHSHLWQIISQCNPKCAVD